MSKRDECVQVGDAQTPEELLSNHLNAKRCLRCRRPSPDFTLCNRCDDGTGKPWPDAPLCGHCKARAPLHDEDCPRIQP